MTELFADTFYFVALLNPRDEYHRMVRNASRANRARIVTTSWVLVETADALCIGGLRSVVHQFLKLASSDPMVRVASESSWLDRGTELFGRRADKDWSLTDCISFAVMTEHCLSHALTGDHHFAQAGFVPVFA